MGHITVFMWGKKKGVRWCEVFSHLNLPVTVVNDIFASLSIHFSHQQIHFKLNKVFSLSLETSVYIYIYIHTHTYNTYTYLL